MSTTHSINIEALLTHVPLFSDLAADELSRIAHATREVQISKGETLFHRGTPCTGFHLIVYGQIKLIFTSAQGNEKIIEIFSQGQSFGEAIMFLDKPYVVSAQALSDTTLLHISKTALFAEMEHDYNLSRKMLSGMAVRLHLLMGDVESYSLQSGKQRVIGYLLRELPEADQQGQDITLSLQSSKGAIASRLNLTQEHFSRILHELSEHGLIRVEGKNIRISDVDKLRKHQS
jgi:CRP/FNR family transcriptional regulator, dissimilatory nitrate respiration regulator